MNNDQSSSTTLSTPVSQNLQTNHNIQECIRRLGADHTSYLSILPPQVKGLLLHTESCTEFFKEAQALTQNMRTIGIDPERLPKLSGNSIEEIQHHFQQIVEKYRTAHWWSKEQFLNWAAGKGYPNVCGCLLADQAIDVNFTDRGMTALHNAAFCGHSNIAELLLNTSGINVNVVNRKRHTPLYVAAALGNANVAKLLIKANANIDTALAAAQKDDKPQTIVLLERIQKEVIQETSISSSSSSLTMPTAPPATSATSTSITGFCAQQ